VFMNSYKCLLCQGSIQPKGTMASCNSLDLLGVLPDPLHGTMSDSSDPLLVALIASNQEHPVNMEKQGEIDRHREQVKCFNRTCCPIPITCPHL